MLGIDNAARLRALRKIANSSHEQRRQSQRRGLSPVSELWQGPPPNALVVDWKVVIGTALQRTAVAGCKPALPGNGHDALAMDLKVVTGTALQRTAVAGYKPALPGGLGTGRSCSGFESRHRNCPAMHGGRRLQTCATGNGHDALVVDLKVVTGNCPATHGDRRLQTCATGEWAQRSCRILKVVTGTGLQHTAVAGL